MASGPSTGPVSAFSTGLGCYTTSPEREAIAWGRVCPDRSEEVGEPTSGFEGRLQSVSVHGDK